MIAPSAIPAQPVIPDYVRAITGHLRAQPALMAVKPTAGTLYVGGDMDSVPAKGWGISVTKVPGSVTDSNAATMRVTVEVRWFGPTKHDAMLLYRTGSPYLEPPGSQRYHGFRAYDCAIVDMQQIAGPADMVDPRDDSPFVWTQYAVTFLTVPIGG